MKKLFRILSIFLLAISCQDNSIENQHKFKTLMIRSQGEVETLSDMATFNISLSCLDKSIEQSKNCLVKKSNELSEELISLGIDQDDILTTSVNLSKSYTWDRNSRVFEGYNSSTRLFVTIRDIDELDEVYTALFGNKNLDLGGLSYSHSKLDSLKNQAYVNAFKKANVLADNLIHELPETKKEVLKIGNVKISASTPQTEQSDNKALYEVAKSSANKSIAINKGTIIVNATLFVEYQIK